MTKTAKWKRSAVLLACLVCGCTLFVVAQEEKPQPPRTVFAKPPSAAVTDRGVEIRFVLVEPADFAVLIKNDKGETLRHLAARKALKREQVVTWDGCTDAGLPVDKGTYRIETAVGLTPRYEAAFGADPEEMGTVHGLAVGPKGTLYVLGGEGRVDREPRFAVFDRRGKYLRTILPRPAGLSPERANPLGTVELDGGERVPLGYLPQYGGGHAAGSGRGAQRRPRVRERFNDGARGTTSIPLR